MNDSLDRQYACLTCHWKGPLGKLRLINGNGPFCPQCKGGDIHPAHGEPIELEEGHGHGSIGTRH